MISSEPDGVREKLLLDLGKPGEPGVDFGAYVSEASKVCLDDSVSADPVGPNFLLKLGDTDEVMGAVAGLSVGGGGRGGRLLDDVP